MHERLKRAARCARVCIYIGPETGSRRCTSSVYKTSRENFYVKLLNKITTTGGQCSPLLDTCHHFAPVLLLL